MNNEKLSDEALKQRIVEALYEVQFDNTSYSEEVKIEFSNGDAAHRFMLLLQDLQVRAVPEDVLQDFRTRRNEWRLVNKKFAQLRDSLPASVIKKLMDEDRLPVTPSHTYPESSEDRLREARQADSLPDR